MQKNSNRLVLWGILFPVPAENFIMIMTLWDHLTMQQHITADPDNWPMLWPLDWYHDHWCHVVTLLLNKMLFHFLWTEQLPQMPYSRMSYSLNVATVTVQSFGSNDKILSVEISSSFSQLFVNGSTASLFLVSGVQKHVDRWDHLDELLMSKWVAFVFHLLIFLVISACLRSELWGKSTALTCSKYRCSYY